EAQKLAEGMDVDFLWECCGEEEFSFDALARDYYGRAAVAVESAALLIKLHGAPMYFYRKGRGRYRATPKAALAAALASVERKRLQAEQKAAYVAQLRDGRLPPEFAAMLDRLLYKEDRNSLEWKALDEASALLRMSPARVIEHCGGLPSSRNYHLNRF